MTKKYYDKIGAECVEHLTALNPRGGIKAFIRMAVEFGYKRAIKDVDFKNKWWNRFFVGFATGVVVMLLGISIFVILIL